MNLDEALRELGVGHDADADVVRRAYLRLLKTRKPEVDPEGFKRLREAYELVKEGQAFAARWRVHFVPPAATDASPATHDAPIAPQPDAPVVQLDLIVAPPDVPVAPSVAESPSPSVAESPAPPVAPSEPLVAQSPEPYVAPPPAPPTASADAGEALPTFDEIAELVRANQPRIAAKRMRAVFDAASAAFAVDVPPLALALETILVLHEKNDLGGADALRRSVQHWLETSGQEVRLVREGIAPLWIFVRELGQLPDSFDTDVRKVLARAAREGELSRARQTLFAHRAIDEEGAKEVAYLLRTRAPAIHAAVGAAFEPAQAPRRQTSSSIGWGILPLLFFVIRFMTMAGNCMAPVNREYDFGSQTSTPPRSPPLNLGQSYVDAGPTHPIDIPPSMLGARGLASALATAAENEKQFFVEANADEIHSALGEADCARALDGMAHLREATRDKAVSPALRKRVTPLELAIRKACALDGGAPESRAAASGDAGAPCGGTL